MMFSERQLNRDIPVPLYYQLQNILSELIISGQLQPGDFIPTEAELVEMYHLSRTTVRQAVMGLVMEGKLHRVKGKGTYVAKPKIVQDFMRKLESYSVQIERLGLSPSTKILNFSRVSPNSDVQEIFGSVDQVIELTRLRYADNEPIVIVNTFLPISCSDTFKEDMTTISLYSFLSRNEDTMVCSAIRQIEAVVASKYESELLLIPVGSPLQMTTTIGRNAKGSPIEYSVAKYRGDKNKFTVELSI